jgi:hypothetical protein
MTYMGRAYYPWWLDTMADDVTSEGAVSTHRPRSSLLLFARPMGERFAGSPLATYVIPPTDETGPAARAEEVSL